MDDKRPFSGFYEVPHTADIAIRVFAPDLPHLFENAAKGLYHILEICAGKSEPEEVRINLGSMDNESLLVSFLNELLYFTEKNIFFREFHLEIEDCHLKGIFKSSRIHSQRKEIKAVTYHELKIEQSNQGLQTLLVFDL